MDQVIVTVRKEDGEILHAIRSSNAAAERTLQQMLDADWRIVSVSHVPRINPQDAQWKDDPARILVVLARGD